MMSIQELWYRKFIGRGGLGYKYPKGGYGINGGALDDNKTEATWMPINTGQSEVGSWIPESTIAGIDPYEIPDIDALIESVKNETDISDKFIKKIESKKAKVKTEKEEAEAERAKELAKAETEHKEYIKKIIKSETPDIDALLESINTKQDEFDNILQNIMTIKNKNQLSQLKNIEKDLKKQLGSLRQSYSLIGTKNMSKLSVAEETISEASKLKTLTTEQAKTLEEQKKIKAEITKKIEDKNYDIKLLEEQIDDNAIQIEELNELLTPKTQDEEEQDQNQAEYYQQMLLDQQEAFNDPEYDEVTLNILNTNNDAKDMFDTPLYMTNDINNDLKTYKKPDAFSSTNINNLTQRRREEQGDVPIKKRYQNNNAFEEISTQPQNVINIIKNLDDTLDINNIKEVNAFNTDNNTGSFRGSKFEPFDVIAIIKMKDGSERKYIIENKFYDNTTLFVGGAKSGSKISYSGLLDMNNRDFESYKKWFFGAYGVSKSIKKYSSYLISIGDDEEAIKEIMDKDLYNKYQQYVQFRNDPKAFYESFHKQMFTSYIPMKLAKTNFDYNTILKDNLYSNDDFTDPNYYTEYINKHKKKFRGQKYAIFDDDGNITEVRRGKVSGEYDIDKNNSWYKGAKLLYLISLSDALLGMNWSNKIKEDEDVRINPLKKYKPTSSAYTKQTKKGNIRLTDSLGLRPQDLTLIKDFGIQPIQQSIQPIVQSLIPVKQKTKTSKSKTTPQSMQSIDQLGITSKSKITKGKKK